MSSLYTDIIQHAYRYPAHRGHIDDPTHIYEDENPLCGDMLRMELRIEDGVVKEATFDGRGCAISQAAAELMVDRIVGQPVIAIDELNKDVALEELGIPEISPARLKCALLSVGTLKAAVRAGAQEPSY